MRRFKRAIFMAFFLMVAAPVLMVAAPVVADDDEAAEKISNILVVGSRELLHKSITIWDYCNSIGHEAPWCPSYQGGTEVAGSEMPNYSGIQDCGDNVTATCKCKGETIKV